MSTCCVNVILASALDTHLTPWFCGALLIAVMRKVMVFILFETLHHLTSKVLSVFACSSLPDLFLPFGQVGVGIPGGLELYMCIP